MINEEKLVTDAIIQYMNSSNETTKVFLEKYLKDFGKQSTVYNAIVEAVTNSIESIDAKRTINKDHKGEINISITRKNQPTLHADNEMNSEIEKIEVSDNGIGFTEDNRNSFNTLYSPLKQSNGGKGLGRMFYIKYFEDVTIESTFYEKTFQTRSFKFGKMYDIVENETIRDAGEKTSTGAKITLSNYCGPTKKFDDSTDTFVHRLLEKILNYFVKDNYDCPIITLIDGENKIILNNQIGDNQQCEISLIDNGAINIEYGSDKAETFKFKVYKLRRVHTQVSRIMLTANNKVVTDVKLEDYIPEFAEDFEEQVGDKNQKFILRYYVYGDYLDRNVNNERTNFYFDDLPTLEYPIGKHDIEFKIAQEAKEKMKDEVTTRSKRKQEAFKQYADKNIWYKNYLSKIDFEKIKINPSTSDIEAELHRAKYKTDLERKNRVESILSTANIKGKNLAQKITEITAELSATDYSNLAQYMVFRKAALDLFEKALQWNESEDYEKEKLIHDIIFPTKRDSRNTYENEHNLWIINESLNFTEYLSSDNSIFTKSDDRPDIAVFHYPVSYRDGDAASNPITIFEFKRPGRTDFINPSSREDPIEQIVRYVIQLRDGCLKQPDGLNINVAETTPFYGYIVASADRNVKKWLLEAKNMTMTPDGEGWFLNSDNIHLRIEFITWEKLLKDAKIRHKTFFEKLGLKI